MNGREMAPVVLGADVEGQGWWSLPRLVPRTRAAVNRRTSLHIGRKNGSQRRAGEQQERALQTPQALRDRGGATKEETSYTTSVDLTDPSGATASATTGSMQLSTDMGLPTQRAFSTECSEGGTHHHGVGARTTGQGLHELSRLVNHRPKLSRFPEHGAYRCPTR